MTSLISRLLVPSASAQASGGVSNEEYDRQLQDLLSDLKHLLAKKDFSVLSEPDLDLLDPSSHSLSYLFILHLQLLAAQTKTKKRLPDDVIPGGRLWNRLVLFLRKFDPIQVRYAGQEWRRILEFVEDAAEAKSKPILAIKPLKEAILRLDPSGSVFTSCRVRFVKLCLRSNTLIHAIPVLEKPICYVGKDGERGDLDEPLCAEDKPSGAFLTERAGFIEKITSRDYLEYFLYGAMIYMSCKRWGDALHFLNVVISTPTVNCVSLVMVEAYKKWILASLLEHGKLIPLPKLITANASRLLRSLTRAYLALAEAFETRDLERLTAEMGLGQAVWHEDNNTGLVCQLTDALRRFTILDMGGTFAALSVTDIVDGEVSWARDAVETESFIASAILSQSMNATLIQRSGDAGSTILRFSDSRPPARLWQEFGAQAQMVTEKRMLSELMSHIERSDHNLEFSREYIDYLHRARKRADQSDGRGYSHGGRSGVDQFDFDEDLMEAMD